MRTFPNLRRIRRLPIAWWAAVISLAVIAGVFVASTVSRAEAAADRYEGLIKVAVATSNLEAGSSIGNEDIRFENRPRAFLPASPIVESPSGRIASTPMVAGEVFTESKVAPGGLSSVAALLRNGERAVSVPNKKDGLRLQIDDTVDIIGSFGNSHESALTLASAGRVVDVGESSATVAVIAQDAPRVALATANGQVALAISSVRPQDDH